MFRLSHSIPLALCLLSFLLHAPAHAADAAPPCPCQCVAAAAAQDACDKLGSAAGCSVMDCEDVNKKTSGKTCCALSTGTVDNIPDEMRAAVEEQKRADAAAGEVADGLDEGDTVVVARKDGDGVHIVGDAGEDEQTIRDMLEKEEGEFEILEHKE